LGRMVGKRKKQNREAPQREGPQTPTSVAWWRGRLRSKKKKQNQFGKKGKTGKRKRKGFTPKQRLEKKNPAILARRHPMEVQRKEKAKSEPLQEKKKRGESWDQRKDSRKPATGMS